MNRRTLVALAGAGSAAMVAGGSRVAAQEQAAGTLVIGTSAEADGYDPAVVTAASSTDLLSVVYDRLVRIDGDGQPQPDLAESWEHPDDLTYTFTLRGGVIFHDGRLMAADDVRYTFERIKDPATESPWASQFEPVASVESDGVRTVTFTLSAPYGPFLAILAATYASIVPKREPAVDFGTTMVGTNAFRIDSVKPNEETVLVRHDGYWQADTPKLDMVTYRILPDEAARLTAIQAGDVGLTILSDPGSVESATASDGLGVIEQETTDAYLLGLNCAKAPFDARPVRQALSKAIDRQAIVDTVLSGRGRVTGPLAPTLGDWAQPVEQMPNYEVDTEGARDLIEEAGQGGLTFRILVGRLYPELVTIAQMIRDQLKGIGVTVEVEAVKWGTFIERIKRRDFDAFVGVNESGNDPDRALYPSFHSSGPLNVFQFASEEVDSLLETGRTTSDREARKGTYQQLVVELANEAPAIFISTRVVTFAARDTVTGFMPTASQTWDTLKTTSVS
jgi:peptide/nickel transport system substrate-binding protein